MLFAPTCEAMCWCNIKITIKKHILQRFKWFNYDNPYFVKSDFHTHMKQKLMDRIFQYGELLFWTPNRLTFGIFLSDLPLFRDPKLVNDNRLDNLHCNLHNIFSIIRSQQSDVLHHSVVNTRHIINIGVYYGPSLKANVAATVCSDLLPFIVVSPSLLCLEIKPHSVISITNWYQKLLFIFSP